MEISMKICDKCKFNYKDICEPQWPPVGPGYCGDCVRWSKGDGCLCVKRVNESSKSCPDFVPKEENDEN